MMAITVMVVILLLLFVAAGAVTAWYCRPPGGLDRKAAARNEAMLAEARMDLLTRQTMQHMRDVVRDDMRRHRGDVIDGGVIE